LAQKTQLAEALRRLDPASRALLDLSLHRGLRTEEIAEVLGTNADDVTSARDMALGEVAELAGMDPRTQRDELRSQLAELPTEAWLGNAAVAEARDDGAGRRRRRLLPWLLAAAALLVAAVVVAIVLATSDDDTRSAPTGTAPASTRTTPTVAQPRPKPKPRAPVAMRKARGLPRRATGFATARGRQLRLRVRRLPRPRGAYDLWLLGPGKSARRLRRTGKGSFDAALRLPATWPRFRYVAVTREPRGRRSRGPGAALLWVRTAQLGARR
jgi:hypothetical protein